MNSAAGLCADTPLFVLAWLQLLMLLRCAVYSMYCTVRYVLNHGAALCYIPWLSNSPFSVKLRGWKRKVSTPLPIRL